MHAHICCFVETFLMFLFHGVEMLAANSRTASPLGSTFNSARSSPVGSTANLDTDWSFALSELLSGEGKDIKKDMEVR